MSICIKPRCFAPNNDPNTQFCQSCGSELLLQGRFRVVRELGGGGFGKTYELIDKTGKVKVLKVLVDDSPKAVELFRREAEVLSVLNHPGIPHVEKDGYFLYLPRNSTKHLHCLVMEKIEGLTLNKYLKQRGNKPIDPDLAIKWLRELTIILQQVHSQNFFHRDIKPTNIMLRTDGRLALIDFGTVRRMTKTYVAKKAVGDVTGIMSSGYTPLEQINGQAVQQSDFFALGRTFIYLLTAKDPNKFYNPYTNLLEWRDVVVGISPKFADLLDEMMENLVGKRPENTQAILQKLGAIDGIFPAAMNHKPVKSNAVNKVVKNNVANKAVKNYAVNKVVKNNVVNKVSPAVTIVQYAEIWQRLLSYIIDSIILFLLGLAIGFSVGFLTGVSSNSGEWGEVVNSGWMGASGGWLFIILKLLNGDLLNLTLVSKLSFLVGTILNWFYFTFFESSLQKATPGKLILNLNVTGSNQEKISLSQANLRYFVKIPSTVLFMVGYIMIAFTPQKQALHDTIANTFIIKKK